MLPNACRRLLVTFWRLSYETISSYSIKHVLLLWELWVRFDFKELLRVTLAVRGDEEYPFVSVDLS